MKWASFFTIKGLDYKIIGAALPNANLPQDVREAIETLIRDHKSLVMYKETLISQQQQVVEGLFGSFDLINDNQTSSAPQENEPPQPDTGNSLPHVLDNTDSPDQTSKDKVNPDNKHNPKKAKNPNKGKKKLPTGNIINHTLSDNDKTCPSCGNKMHMQRSKTKTMVVALPLFSTETHISESCRCLACETQKTAPLPVKVESECIGRYHYSAVVNLAALRYLNGLPSFSIENNSNSFGLKISDSTQWYLFEELATLLRSFYIFLEKKSANAQVQHVDDTNNLIIDLAKDIEEKKQEALNQGKNPDSIRSGIHTTNLTAIFPEGKIVLYKTGLHHSGEVLAQVLSARTIEEQVIIMTDAASANTSKIDHENNKDLILANCNSHAMRKFKEHAQAEEKLAKEHLIKEFQISDILNYFLLRYKTIFKNDSETKNMSLDKRLLFHRENSLPLMIEMKNKIQLCFANREVEPSSDLGSTFKYFLKHFDKFCAFCYFEGAPVCNNLSERMLKAIIRQRKNSLFFKTQLGAKVADIMESLYDFSFAERAIFSWPPLCHRAFYHRFKLRIY